MRFLTAIVLCILGAVHAFVPPQMARNYGKFSSLSSQKREISIQETLDDEKVTKLFAWVSRAFAGDQRYNDLMLALAAVFGNVAELEDMLDEAMLYLAEEDEPAGASYSLGLREEASLGAMGAAQWTGAWRTRPHALLDISGFTSVDDWVATLPRGCKRTIKNKALKQNFTVTTRPILPNRPAPHSSLAHFRCVVEHELRLLASNIGFFDALANGVSRYIGTTRMVGEIQEYRDAETGRVLAFAHEVRKGDTIRGQWFYGTDEASKRYVWFHSVYALVKRAIASDRIKVVDLGPSGSDAFSELKAKYGFESVVDWPAVADYKGPFWYDEVAVEDKVQ